MEDDSPLAGRNDQEADADADEVPDWTQFAAFARTLKKTSATEAFIPRRGEKDYAPSDLLAERQASALERARDAMYSAIEAGDVRQHSSRQHNRATWHPAIARAAMDPEHMGSVHFRTMGRYHSGRKRTELLPEEAVYLVERGTLQCWTEEGVPMSVQQAFVQIIGTEGLTMEHYQATAFSERTLRQCCHHRVRASPVDEHQNPASRHTGHPSDAFCKPFDYASPPEQDLLQWPVASYGLDWAVRVRVGGRWRPGSTAAYSRLLGGERTIFSALQVIPCGHDIPLAPGRTVKLPAPAAEEPFRVFFHVYKPVTKFPKTSPPPPDYYLAVVNARFTPLFDLEHATALLQSIPFHDASSLTPPARPHPSKAAAKPLTGWRTWLPSWMRSSGPPARPPNPYPRLKAGRRSVVVAIVDSGTSTFLRFAEGDFGNATWVGEGKL